MAEPVDTLGPFEVEGPLGRGGMATVWRARRCSDGLPVAVKTVRADHEDRAEWRLRFSAEVAAVAALDHPHIVRILDHGIAATGALASRGPGGPAVGAPTPWLAMELADTHLGREGQRFGWSGCRAVLDELLQALAHAHARGIVHRDVKPSNVLLRSVDGHVLLSDFGIAWLRHADQDGPPAATELATPRFAAPEQLLGQWWRQGPWTDLYAVGCLGWWLVTGAAPFPLDDAVQLVEAHCRGPLPPLAPRFDVPEGLEGWLGSLLQKAPQARPDRAAWARAGLLALGAPVPASVGSSAGRQPDLDGPTRTQAVAPSPAPAAAPVPAVWGPVAPLGCPSEPPEPFRPDGTRPVAVSLLGLRPHRPRGRSRVEGQLWRVLAASADLGRPRLVVLRGAEGAGKRDLARWLAWEGHAAGVAAVVEVGDEGAPPAALARAILAALPLPPMDDPARPAAIAETLGLDPFDRQALCALAGEGDATSPRDASGALLRAVVALGRGRVVVIASTGEGAPDAVLGWCRTVLDRAAGLGSPVPVVWLVAVDGYGLADPVEPLVAALAEREDTRVLHLAPLGAAELSGMLTAELLIAPELAVQVAERANGLPGMALAVVERGLATGALELVGGRLEGRADVALPTPGGAMVVWQERLLRVAAGWSPGAWRAVAAAALLGPDGTAAHWRKVCGPLDAMAGMRAVEDLVRAGLALVVAPQADSWRFAHPLVAEAAVQWLSGPERARVAGAVADALTGTSRTDLLARRLRCLELAGRPAEAAAAALSLVQAQLARGSDAAAAATLARLDPGRPEVLALWPQITVLRARRARLQADLATAEDEATRALAAAEATHLTDVAAQARLEQAWVALYSGRMVAALRLAEACEAGASGRVAAEAAGLAANALFMTGALVEARGRYVQAVDAYAELGDLGAEGAALQGLGNIALADGALGQARETLDRALDRARRAGRRAAAGDCLNSLGEVARMQGDLDQAATFYAQARDHLEAAGSQRSLYPRANLATVEHARGRPASAHRICQALRPLIDSGGHTNLGIEVDLLDARCLLALGDLRAARAAASRALDGIQRVCLVDVNLGAGLDALGGLAAPLDPTLARRALVAAEAQWRGLGRDTAAAATRTRLEQLEP